MARKFQVVHTLVTSRGKEMERGTFVGNLTKEPAHLGLNVNLTINVEFVISSDMELTFAGKVMVK